MNLQVNLTFSKYVELDCFCWLYIRSYLRFSFQVSSTQGVFLLQSDSDQGLAPNEDSRTEAVRK